MSENQSTTPDLDPLAPRLEEALLVSGESQTSFGYLKFRDPAFFKKMREGRKFRARVRAKAEEVLREYGV